MATKPSTVRLILISALGAILLALAPAAIAGKGHGAGKLGDPSVTISPAGPYSFGEPIYVTTDAPTYPNNAGPWIELMCYQNGGVVASGDHAGFPGGMGYNDPFNLGPTMSWSGGAADCTVTVFHQSNNRFVTDASTSFRVNA
jgi:hypothetical protein